MNTKSLGMSNFPIKRASAARVVALSAAFILIFRVCAFGSISISGTYLGKNLHVSNPVSDDGFGFAITKVIVNEKIVPLKFNGDDVEIDFAGIGLLPGNQINVVIRSENDRCLIIRNPDSIGNAIITNSDDRSEIGINPSENQREAVDEIWMMRRQRKFIPENR